MNTHGTATGCGVGRQDLTFLGFRPGAGLGRRRAPGVALSGPGSPRGPEAPPGPPVTRAKPVSGPQSRARAQDRAATAHPWVPGPPSCAPASRGPPGNRGRRRGPGRSGGGARGAEGGALAWGRSRRRPRGPALLSRRIRTPQLPPDPQPHFVSQGRPRLRVALRPTESFHSPK